MNNEDLIVAMSEVIEKADAEGLMKKHLRIFFYDRKNDKVISKEFVVENL